MCPNIRKGDGGQDMSNLFVDGSNNKNSYYILY